MVSTGPLPSEDNSAQYVVLIAALAKLLGGTVVLDMIDWENARVNVRCGKVTVRTQQDPFRVRVEVQE